MSIFTGSGTAIVTPFNKNGIDFDAFDRLIQFQLDNRTDAIIVCGTTGEASTMTSEEKRAAIRFAVERVAGRIPVIAGTGSNNTAATVEFSAQACELKVDGLLVVTPYYNKTSASGLVAHFNAVADAVSAPIIAYNVPGRTGLNLLPATMRELLKHRNIIGVKEASGNIEQIVTLAALCPECDIYSGNDDHVIPMMAVGAKGVISTIANVVPGEMHDMCAAFLSGDVIAARALQFKVLPLWKAAFCEVNPIAIKTMVSMMGLCDGGLRLPLVAPTAANLAFIRESMQNYGLI